MRAAAVLTVIVAAVALTLTFMMNRRPEPTQAYRTGAVLLDEPFDSPYSWETYRDARLDAHLRVEGGVYRAQINREGFMWGLNVQRHTDVVIDVETRQYSEANDNAYGVMCRANPTANGDGYYFLISGDGYWSIRRIARGQGRALAQFDHGRSIQQGQSVNQLRVVCIEDYLALYINAEFAGEARDSLYSSGFAGLVVSGRDDLPADIAFDNLRLRAAALAP